MVTKHVPMTAIYTNSFFSRIHLFKVGRTANKRTKKAPLITNNLTVQSYQININMTKLVDREYLICSLVERAYLICSNIALRNKEIDDLNKVFHKKSHYPKWVINQVLNEVEEKHKTSVNNVSKESQVSL